MRLEIPASPREAENGHGPWYWVRSVDSPPGNAVYHLFDGRCGGMRCGDNIPGQIVAEEPYSGSRRCDGCRATLYAAEPTPATSDRALLEGLLKLIDIVRGDSEGRYPIPDPGCPECTLGTVPEKSNRGLCIEHKARAVLLQTAGGIPPIDHGFVPNPWPKRDACDARVKDSERTPTRQCGRPRKEHRA